MGIIAWIILGLIAGVIAKAIYPGYQSSSILGTMLLGIVGAFVGGSIYHFLVTGTLSLASVSFSFGGILVAVLGALVALYLYYLFVSRRVY